MRAISAVRFERRKNVRALDDFQILNRSAGRGNWERIGHQQFTRSFVFFRFDSARNYLGTGENTTTITLSEDGSEFQANAVTRIFDGSGNLVNTLQFTEVGQRL